LFFWRCLQELFTGNSGEDEGNKSRDFARKKQPKNRSVYVQLLFFMEFW
jgi:hypothetical protein